MILCVGPEGTGKTLLLRRIVSQGEKNFITKTIPTVGVDIITLKQNEQLPPIHMRELGGTMAPIWHSYYRGVKKVLYVIDGPNIMQLGSATLSFLNMINHPHLRSAEIAIVVNKTDCPMARNVKEITGVMRLDEVKKHAFQKTFVIFEVSALANKGIRPLIKWITGEKPPPA